MIRRVLYSLKRQYGGNIVVYQGTSVADAKTGLLTQTSTSTGINRAIVLPVQMTREARQALSGASSNASLSRGWGGVESGKRLFIIDRSDAPTLIVTMSDWIGYDGRKYSIEILEEYEYEAAWLITGKEMVGDLITGSVHTLTSNSDISLQAGTNTVLES